MFDCPAKMNTRIGSLADPMPTVAARLRKIANLSRFGRVICSIVGPIGQDGENEHGRITRASWRVLDWRLGFSEDRQPCRTSAMSSRILSPTSSARRAVSTIRPMTCPRALATRGTAARPLRSGRASRFAETDGSCRPAGGFLALSGVSACAQGVRHRESRRIDDTAAAGVPARLGERGVYQG